MEAYSLWEQFMKLQEWYWGQYISQIQLFSYKNPFLFTFSCLVLAFFLELILPRQINYGVVKRKGFWLDLFYVLFYDFIIIFLGLFAVTFLLDHYFFKLLFTFGIEREALKLVDMKTFPILVQVIVLFVFTDFMEWLAHFLMHRFDFLWAFHKIHHAQEQIGVTSSRHFHIGEFLVFRPLAYLPTVLLGYTVSDYSLISTFVFVFLAFFTHANSKIPLGFLNYIFNSPNTHIWHHAQNIPHKYGVNFASALNIWDVLFGFYYLPKDKDKVPELGVFDMEEVPKSFLGQFFYPFKYLFKSKWTTNQYDTIPKAYKQSKKKDKKKKTNKK